MSCGLTNSGNEVYNLRQSGESRPFPFVSKGSAMSDTQRDMYQNKESLREGSGHGPRHMAQTDGGSEPFDLLGWLSLGFGIMALLMLPVLATPAFVALIGFGSTSIILGSVRLVDRRFNHRSDAAIAGIIASIVIFCISLCSFASNAIGALWRYVPSGFPATSPTAVTRPTQTDEPTSYDGTKKDVEATPENKPDDNGTEADATLQQVPLADADDSRIQQVPLATNGETNARKA